MGYTEFLSIDWTIVFQILNTLILFLLMKKFFFVPVKNMIDAREKEVETIYSDAEHEKAEAAKMKQDYEKSIAGAREEANEIVQSAQKRALVRSDEIIAEAQGKANVLREKAEQEIERDKKKAINEIKGEISSIAMLIASKVVQKDINAADHERLVEQFIDGVGDTAWKE